jgi:hypothetical protein
VITEWLAALFRTLFFHRRRVFACESSAAEANLPKGPPADHFENDFQNMELLLYCKQENSRERRLSVMEVSQYDKVCRWTERRDEQVHLRNLKTGATGYSFGCTYEGETIQVRLDNGELDSWGKEECVEITETVH